MPLWLEIVNVRLVEEASTAKVEVQVRGDRGDRVNGDLSWFELPDAVERDHKDGIHGVYKELAEALEKKRLAIARFGCACTDAASPESVAEPRVVAWRIQYADPASARA